MIFDFTFVQTACVPARAGGARRRYVRVQIAGTEGRASTKKRLLKNNAFKQPFKMPVRSGWIAVLTGVLPRAVVYCGKDCPEQCQRRCEKFKMSFFTPPFGSGFLNRTGGQEAFYLIRVNFARKKPSVPNSSGKRVTEAKAFGMRSAHGTKSGCSRRKRAVFSSFSAGWSVHVE